MVKKWTHTHSRRSYYNKSWHWFKNNNGHKHLTQSMDPDPQHCRTETCTDPMKWGVAKRCVVSGHPFKWRENWRHLLLISFTWWLMLTKLSPLYASSIFKKKAPAIGATYILVHSVNTRRQLVCQTEIHVLQDLMEKWRVVVWRKPFSQPALRSSLSLQFKNCTVFIVFSPFETPPFWLLSLWKISFPVVNQ